MLWSLTPENEKEILAVNNLLLKMREEEQEKENIRKCKHEISFVVADSISKIGLVNTKRIVREINKELREQSEG